MVRIIYSLKYVIMDRGNLYTQTHITHTTYMHNQRHSQVNANALRIALAVAALMLLAAMLTIMMVRI